MADYIVVRKGKRWMIVDFHCPDEVIYCPPNFLRSRADVYRLRQLADRLALGQDRLEAVMAFETELRPEGDCVSYRTMQVHRHRRRR